MLSTQAVLCGALTMGLALSSTHAQVFTAHSSSSCTVKASSYTQKGNDEATARAVKEVSEFLCDGHLEATGDPAAIASSTAHAFAEAVAHASVDCTIKGKGSVSASAHAKAEEKAHVWLNAYARAVSSAEVCGKCEAYAEASVEILEKVLLHAVAEVYVKVDEASNNPHGHITISEADTQRQLVEASVSAFADALALAVDNSAGTACGAAVDVAVSTPDSSAQCWTTTLVQDDNSFNDAIATASADVAAVSCSDEGLSEASADVAARAVATAVARAFGSVLGGCTTENNGYACVENDGWIETVASATAKATAEAWASAIGCDCTVNTESFATALGGVISRAATDVYRSKCKGGGKSITKEIFKSDFEELSVKAVAKAFAHAWSSGDKCVVEDITTDASVCQCVGKYEYCALDSSNVLGCCDEGFSCIKSKRAKEKRAKCRKNKALDKKNRKGVLRNVALPQTCGSH